MTDLAKDPFSVMLCDPFQCELFERYLRELQESTEASKGSGPQKPFLMFIGGKRLKQLTELLIDVVCSRRRHEPSFSLKRMCSDSSVDPLCCPICEDILRYPVTTTCGHTFCRQCCFGHSQCAVCSQKFPTISSGAANGSSPQATVTSGSSATTLTLLPPPPPSAAGPTSTATSSSSSMSLGMATVITNHDRLGEPDLPAPISSEVGSEGSSGESSVIGLEQDILVRRLVERWWGPELKAAELNEETQRHLESDALDEALRCCNQSLEYAPNSHKGLLLRSEVLYRLQHYQSALADADNALKSRPTSYKAHYYRALALSALGRFEEAIISHCISIFLDKQSMCVASGIKEELAKDLQKLLATVRSEPDLPPPVVDPLSLIISEYTLLSSRKRRRLRIPSAHKHKAKKQFLSLRTSDFDEDHSDCGDEEYYFRSDFFDEMDEEFLRQTMNPPHHRRKSLSAYNLNIFNPRMDAPLGVGKEQKYLRQQLEKQQQQTTIIPRPSSKLRLFVDRMIKELEAVRWAEGSPVRLGVHPSQIETSDFDCVLCCRTLWRPVVTPCGHTYCWVCLDRCMDYSSSCPLCMAPLIEQFRHHLAGNSGHSNGNSLALLAATNPTLISLSKRKVTQFVEVAMQRFIPDAYEKRQRQELDREPTVPVFICTTAFPSVPCPLFVYEPRYRLMVRRAIESGERQFGIALPQQNGRQRYVEYGTMLDIRDCVQLGDGCSILSTVGARRFRVIARQEKDGYDTANVEFIEDVKIVDGAGAGLEEERVHLVRELHEKVLMKAIGWHESLPENIKCEIFKSFGKMPDLEENWEDVVDGPAWAWWIIAILPLSQHLKVDILSTTSLEKRLRAIDKTLNLESVQQKRKRSVSVVPASPASPPPAGCCDGIQSSATAHQQQQQQQHSHHQHNHHHQQQQCQAIDCCIRERTTSTHHHHHHHDHEHVHHHHHHDSDRNSSGDHHLSQSAAEAADYLL